MHSTAVDVQFVFLALLCLALVRYLAAKEISRDVQVTCYVSWLLGFSGVILLPYDISTVLGSTNDDHTRVSSLVDGWSLIYWSTFVLAWIILPLQLEFHNSGCFSFRAKLKDSVFRSVRYYAILSTLLLAYIIYRLIWNHDSPVTAWALLMAGGNTYGVLLLVVLAGSGMVALPRRLWHLADSDRALRLLYISAARVESAMQETRYELQDTEAEVKQTEEALQVADPSFVAQSGMDVQMAVVADRVALFHTENSLANWSAHATRPGAPSVEFTLNESHIVDLHARLKRVHMKTIAHERRWLQLQHDVAFLEEGKAAADATMQQMRTAAAGSHATVGSRIRTYFSGFQVACSFKYKQFFLRVVALTLLLLSATLLCCELLLSSDYNTPLGHLLGAYSDANSTGSDEISVQMASFCSLLYLAVCAYYSLFTLNLGWEYSLAGPQHSPTPAFIFNAEYATRLQFALCYNFLLLVQSPRMKNTAFQVIVNRMPLLGATVQTYLPIAMIIVAVITCFNWLEKLMNLIPGCEAESHVDDAGDEEDSVKIGQLLVAKHQHHSRRATRAAKDDRAQKDTEFLRPRVPLTLTNFKVAVVSRNAAALYGNVGCRAGDNEDDTDEDIEMRDTIVRNPLGISGSSLWANNSSRTVDTAVEEEENVFTGRYGN